MEAIVDYQLVHGYPPTIRELCRILGLRSSSTIHAHLLALQRKGAIARNGNSPRAIRVYYREKGEDT